MDLMEEVEYNEYDDLEEELPALNEGDEAISLHDLLVERDKCLTEEELWALCRECCLVLEVVNGSPEMFQTLCVTPDTVAFDGAGNVCFLDLDKDPETLYIPPEYENVGNSYKSHLFSLGMTLLYAAEYNGEPGQPEICPELRELFGCMTSEHVDNRPDLEFIITQCEEELCGKSSQEVCCQIGAFATSFTPAPEIPSVSSLADVTEGITNYLSSQSTIVPITDNDAILGPQQHSTPSGSPTTRKLLHDSFHDNQILNSDLNEKEDMPMRGMLTGQPVPTGNRERKSATRGQSKSGTNFSSNLIYNSSENLTHDLNFNISEIKDASKDSTLNLSETRSHSAKTHSVSDSVSKVLDKPKPPLPKKPSRNESNNDSGMIDDGDNTISEKANKVLHNDKTAPIPSPRTHSMKPQEIKELKTQNESDLNVSNSSLKRTESEEISSSSSETKPKRSKKKQGLSISEALDSLNRDLSEEELWALCREGALALQRKKKHLPAYLSPDTLVMRENGNVSFKAIPEDKPLEVIFMAPELQQRGVLSDKTCLYGLGVTLRCAGGKKYSPISAMTVSEELKGLLLDFVQPDPSKRPSLEATLQKCDNHECTTGMFSNHICKNLFQEAFTKMMNSTNVEEKEPDVAKESVPVSQSKTVSKTKPKPPPKPPSPMLSAFRPIKGPITKPQIGSSSSMFAPVPVKPVPEKKMENGVPSAFTSSATHFKPIIIQKPATPIVDSVATEKSDNAKDKPNENDKEVVRKLKELKKNLMKHRQPGVVKDAETEEKENQNQSAKPASEKKEVSDDKAKTANAGSLETLLGELQKQGSLPDTQSLAAAIAQHLSGHLQGTKSSNPAPEPLNPTGQMPNSMPAVNQMFNMQLSQQLSNIPQQFQQHLMNQGMSIPPMGQFGGPMLPGYPLQVQLQQDPRTGLFQMVPVSVVSVSSAPGSQANSDEYNNIEDMSHMSDPGKSPKLRKKGTSDTPGSGDVAKQKQNRHGRTAKDLIQKTANMRLKNTQQNVPTNSSLINHRDCDEKHWSPNNDKSDKPSSSPKLAFSSDLSTSADKTNSAPFNSLPRQRSVPHNINNSSGNYHLHLTSHRTRSNSSSPSPSKDSGVSGMNGVYKPPPPGSLVERLLNSNTSLTQQQKMGRLVHLLREEFAFDGYMENGVEDINMAEYVMSLANLKWETFTSAISEKYSDMYWKVDLLVSLYEAVNGVKPAILSQSTNQNRNSLQPLSIDKISVPPNKIPRVKHREDHDGSSSSMSESNQERSYRKRRAEITFNSPSDSNGNRPRSVNALKANYDTSDSTDTENMGNRRRHRRKHLEKTKSSSMHNLATNTTFTITSDNSDSIDNDSKTNNAQDMPTNANTQPDIVHSQSLPQNSDSSHLSSNGAQNNNHERETHVIHVESQKSDQHMHYRKNVVRNGDGSLSSRSSSLSDIRSATRLTRNMSQLSLSDGQQEKYLHHKRTHVLYHYAMMQICMSKDLEKFVQDIDEENAEKLESQLATLEQQIMMERRTRRKTQVFFNKLADTPKNSKGDQKTAQVSKDLNEMGDKIRYLQLCKNHIEMLQAELNSINSTFLYSLSESQSDTVLKLKPSCENPLLQFQTLREPQSGCEIQVVQAGTPEGLMSYLFASTALSFGYLHQFLYGYRYFLTPAELLNFITDKYTSISRGKLRETNMLRIQRRVIDILHFWIEGFFSVDFEDNEQLQQDLQFFLEEQNISTASKEGGQVQELLNMCIEGNSLDLLTNVSVGENVHVYKQEGSIRKWDTLKTLKLDKTTKQQTCTKSGFPVCLEKRRNSLHMEEVYFPRTARRTDAFALADYTPQCIAEQLTLIEQGLFQMTHSVHYMNSKALGVSVALTLAGSRAPSVMRLNNTEEQVQQSPDSLFLTDISQDSAIKRMIEHSKDISHWVAAEIVSCSSSKSQLAVLSKFLHAAQILKEMRNYATCLAISDGLENLIIKQLPTWKNLPSKSIAIMEDLTSVRMFLKNDAMSLMKHSDSHLYPTIPSVLLFLLHVQQQEIGSFKLANDMVKWNKIRSIAQTVDQIRIFKDQVYGYESDYEMQDTLMQRVREFSSQDIQAIASQHDTNFHKMPSGGLSAAIRKMKGKFQSK